MAAIIPSGKSSNNDTEGNGLSVAGAQIGEEAMLDALGRLVGHGGQMKLFGAGKAVALFPSRTAATQRLVQELVSRGFLVVDDPDATASAGTITELGRTWLVGTQSPRLLLEDLLAATELACGRLREIETACRLQCQQLEQQRGDILRVLERVESSAARNRIEPLIESALEQHAHSGRVEACSLSDLYSSVRRELPGVTIGQFHDRLRAMHEAGRIRLTPWTGPLYELHEPFLAMLVGHEVLYYVRRSDKRAA